MSTYHVVIYAVLFFGHGIFQLWAYRKGCSLKVKLGAPLLTLPLLLLAIQLGGLYAAYLLLVPVIHTILYTAMAVTGIEALLCLRRRRADKRFVGLLLLLAVLVGVKFYLRRML
ncbi:hypothetical protein [Paenibacillus sp. CF384]|uniref:hypothetical protein n=1 Tax=Paenibacillus sp. CF384 TaxID=1884382 RepID=UPI00089D8319|nr:hypothetical protein [Paenibacillus sp. CF384]SDX92704.1 hypothetical protein SAMN05518855_10298 [Paenibacillus sp. CF384]